jgi:hypothetical protein
MIAVEATAVERVGQARLDEAVTLHIDAHDGRNVRCVAEGAEVYDRGHGRPPNGGAVVGSTYILPDTGLGIQARTTKPATTTRSGCNPLDNLTT